MSDVQVSGAKWYRDITRAQWMALALAGLGWTFESYDSYSLSLTIPFISQHFTMSKTLVGSLLSLTAAGQMVGGILFGFVADRIGRVKTAFLCICIYSLFSGLFACAQSVEQLFILRVCGAFGMGGMWTAGAALVAESWPAHLRGRGGALMQAGLPTGAIVAIAASAVVGETIGLADEGWRVPYLIGALPALILFFVARATPESPVWIAQRHRKQIAHDARQGVGPSILKPALIAFGLVFCLQYVFWG